MYEVIIQRHFSAAHRLPDIGGQCEELHGHNFLVEVTVASDELTKEGLLVDFRIVKAWVDEVLQELDHKYLNELAYFMKINPSAENLARYLFDKISLRAREANLSLSQVTVWESPNARVTYRP